MSDPIPTKPIRVLIVDDSAFVRKVVRELLAQDPAIAVVGVARDGEDALRQAAELHPDAITCDLTMPGMGGVEFVGRQMRARPVPILLLSAAAEDAEQVIEAMDAGAVDFVRKPTALATHDLLKIGDELREKVRAAGHAPAANLVPRPVMAPAEFRRTPGSPRYDLVALGVSTGGPQALRMVLARFPKDFPIPIAIVIHMPIGYTALLASKLNEISPLTVTEAREGQVLEAGTAVVAPAGRHLTFRRGADGQLRAQLALHPLDKIHRPSVDVLFQSAAETLGARVLGVVMTGMGDDGCQGSAWVKAQGGTILTEAESTCVIYGMPRSVAEAGLSDAAVPLDEMVAAILQRI